MKILPKPQSILATVAANQVENGLWEQVHFYDETNYMSLTNKKDGVDITVVAYDCGTKAAIYRLPLNDQNRIIADYTEQGLIDGILSLHKRIIPSRHWVLHNNAA